MPPEQIRQFIRNSVHAELANGTLERDWSSLQFRFPTRHAMPAATPFARWHHQALGSLRGVMRSTAQHVLHLLPFFK
jgi:hypothetical protein